jgi:hypothetical protein
MEERQMQQFIESYRYEEDCEAFLCKLRWPNGFVCPRCDHDQCYLLQTRMLYECRGCRVQVSSTAGTVMHNSKLPLQVWFMAFQLLIQGKQEVSALSLAKELGVNYRTARLMLSKIKLALHQQNARIEAFKNMSAKTKEQPAAQEPSCRQANQQADKHADRESDRQANQQADKQADQESTLLTVQLTFQEAEGIMAYKDEPYKSGSLMSSLGLDHVQQAVTSTSASLIRAVSREGCYRAIWRTRLFGFSWIRDKMPNPVKLFKMWMNAFTSIYPRYVFYL